jgi:hypothetical protein
LSVASLVTHKMIHSLDERGRCVKRERVAIDPAEQITLGGLGLLRTHQAPRNTSMSATRRAATYVTQTNSSGRLTAPQLRRAKHKDNRARRVTV